MLPMLVDPGVVPMADSPTRRKKQAAAVGEEEKADATLRVRTAFRDRVQDVAEARGLPVWKVIEDLTRATLPAAWDASQATLKEIRKQKAKIAAIQEEARKALGG